MMKKRKLYEKPAMQVYELKQQPQLLVGSSVDTRSSIDDWGNGGTTDDEVYM